MIKKSVFFFPIWGDQYIENFSKFALKCLLNNINQVEKNKLENSKIEIWTKKDDIKKLLNLKNLQDIKKKIFVNFNKIDDILYVAKSEKLTKYETLSILQKILINSHSTKYDYFWFIYPDFIFSNNLIKNFINLKKNYSAYFIPVPQLIEEKILKITQNNNNFKTTVYDIEKLILENIHPIIKICNINNTKTNTPSMFYIKKKNIMAFRYYHMHPIVVKSDLKNLELNNFFFSSLDGQLTNYLDHKKFFISKSSKFACCASLLGEEELKLPNDKFNLYLTKTWCSFNVSKQHKFISKFTYFLNHKNEKINKKYFDTKFNKRINKINHSYDFKFTNNLYLESNILKLNEIFKSISYDNFFRNFLKINNFKEKYLEIYKKNKSKLCKNIAELYLDND